MFLEGSILSGVKKRPPMTPTSRRSPFSRKGKESLKELLRKMPPVGEDTDFERIQDFGRDEIVDASAP